MINEEFISQQKQKIEQKIAELEAEVNESRDYQDLGSSDDEKTQEFEAFEEKNAVSNAAQQELKDLRCALNRINEGKYGLCIKCEQPIELGRLKGYLGAVYCSTHAR